MNSLTWAVVLLAGLACVQGSGTPARIEEYPSTLQVLNKVATVWLQQSVCNLITNFHGLGAASAFQDIRQNRRICPGSQVRGNCEVTREVLYFTIHPEYNPTTRHADIAIIRFSLSVVFGPTVNTIQILPQGYQLPQNIPISTNGYGITTEGGIVSNNNLHRLDLETKSCLPAHSDISVTDKICAGLPAPGTGRDFDARDIGAPIILQGVLAGVSSTGRIRENDAIPIVATSTGYYSNWIVANAN